jgi:hypothetical protein
MANPELRADMCERDKAPRLITRIPVIASPTVEAMRFLPTMATELSGGVLRGVRTAFADDV